MKRLILICGILYVLTVPAAALDLTVPTIPEVSPGEPQNFGDDLLQIIRDALDRFRPDLKEAASACVTILAVGMALSLGLSMPGRPKGAVELVGTILTASVLLEPARALVGLGVETVMELSEYEKLLLPVLTAALAAQGGTSTSAALYAGTAAFNAALSAIVSGLLVPGVWVFLALAVGYGATGDGILKKMRDQVRAASVWGLKTILYVYTGYISITGVVSGATDASLLKAAKLTISGAVPVVGGILSDASDAVLASAAAVKNAAGIYGMLAIISMWLGPFLRIGMHYLMLKAAGTVSGVFGVGSLSGVVEDFAAAMGLLLAMTGAVCLMLIISTICFLRGAVG